MPWRELLDLVHDRLRPHGVLVCLALEPVPDRLPAPWRCVDRQSYAAAATVAGSGRSAPTSLPDRTREPAIWILRRNRHSPPYPRRLAANPSPHVRMSNALKWRRCRRPRLRCRASGSGARSGGWVTLALALGCVHAEWLPLAEPRIPTAKSSCWPRTTPTTGCPGPRASAGP